MRVQLARVRLGLGDAEAAAGVLREVVATADAARLRPLQSQAALAFSRALEAQGALAEAADQARQTLVQSRLAVAEFF